LAKAGNSLNEITPRNFIFRVREFATVFKDGSFLPNEHAVLKYREI
jgi:glycyl-tRNA synthetase (class II)